MVLCWIALPIFALLGIFSVKYRRLTIESLECMFRTVTFQKCKSSLDDRIKSSVTGKLMKFSPRTAGVFYKNYKLISFVLLAIFLWSGYAGAVGIYNYINYGNCNGPSSTGFCLLNPFGRNSGVSVLDNNGINRIILPQVEENDPIIGNKNAEITIIEFGAFRCKYTKQAESIISEVLDYYDGKVNIQFKSVVIPNHQYEYEASLAANCAFEQGKYKEYSDNLFALQDVLNYEMLFEIANEINLDKNSFDSCLRNEKYKEEVLADTQAAVNAGVTGTPTFFVNDKIIAGPKPFKTFKKIINKELK